MKCHVMYHAYMNFRAYDGCMFVCVCVCVCVDNLLKKPLMELGCGTQ